MKQVFTKKGEIIVEEVPPPACGDGEVLVANVCSVISIGTELAMIAESGQHPIAKLLKNATLRKKALEFLKKKGG